MGPLADLLDLRHIVVRATETTADDLIRSLAARLAAAGAVGDGYGDACVRREGTDPTGLPTAGAGVAIPHADPDLVVRDAIAVGIPERPVPFRQMGDPDVEVMAEAVFLLALTGAGQQLSVLRQVASFVQDPERLLALIGAESPTDIHDLIASHDPEE